MPVVACLVVASLWSTSARADQEVALQLPGLKVVVPDGWVYEAGEIGGRPEVFKDAGGAVIVRFGMDITSCVETVAQFALGGGEMVGQISDPPQGWSGWNFVSDGVPVTLHCRADERTGVPVYFHVMGDSADTGTFLRAYSAGIDAYIDSLVGVTTAPDAVATTPDVTTPGVTTHDGAERRRTFMFTMTGGVAHTTHEGGTLYGGRAAMVVMTMLPLGKVPLGVGPGLRWNDGADIHGSRLIDIDYVLGGGLLVGGLALGPLVGFGGDFTPAAADAPPTAFVVKGGGYAQYGARLGYAFKFPLTLEAMYTKAFRAPDVLPRETRLDVRVVIYWIALTMRYTEYGTVPDSYGVFGPDGRTAQTYWFMGGFGM